MSHDPVDITAKIESFLQFHRRIVEEFQRSLDNSAHFLKLAVKSMEPEPEATISMVNQIGEIGILPKLETQFQEFQQMAAMLTSMPGQSAGLELGESVDTMKDDYEVLLAEAEEQAEKILDILNLLEHPH